MRLTGRFSLAAAVLISSSLFFSYLATIDPFQTCTRPLMMKNDDEPNGKNVLVAGMTYSVHGPDTAMWIRPTGAGDDQSYIITGDGGKPRPPGSCNSENPTCDKKVSDGYLWGFAGMAAALAFLLVAQYLVPDNMTMLVSILISLLVVAYFVLNIVNLIIIESGYMGGTNKHVVKDFNDFTANATDSVFAQEETGGDKFTYSKSHAVCKTGPAQWWTILSFVSALVTFLIYASAVFFDQALISYFGFSSADVSAKKADRPSGRLAGFGAIVVLVVCATLIGMNGTDQNYGSYVQENIEKTSLIATDDVQQANMKCYFDNHWDVSKHGVRAYMTGTAKNGTYVKPRLSELASRLARKDFVYDMDMWEARGDSDGAFYDAMDLYLESTYDTGMIGAKTPGVAQLTFVVALIDTAPKNASKDNIFEYRANAFKTAQTDNFTDRVTITCSHPSNPDEKCLKVAATAARCMSDGTSSSCSSSLLEGLTGLIQPNITMSAAGRDYFLKAFVANMAPGPNGVSPMECSAWNHDIDVDSLFKWKDCKSIKEDLNGNDCMQSACRTRHYDLTYSFFAFMAVPGVTALLWAFNWTMGNDDFMSKVMATGIALFAYLPVLVFIGLSAFKTAKEDPGNNDCPAKDLGYFFGALTDHAPEEHGINTASAEWVEDKDRVTFLTLAFSFYVVAYVGVIGMIWTSNGTGSFVGASMSDAEKQTGKFTRLTTGF